MSEYGKVGVAVRNIRRADFHAVEALGRHGVKSFHAMGEPFDPKVHEAIMAVPAGDKPPGTVVLQHGRGFLLNDRLVRPALVAVAAPPAQDGDGKGNAG